MFTTFTILSITSISVGAGATLLNDIFFILAKRNHRVRMREAQIIQRFNLTGLVGAFIAVISEMVLFSYRIQLGTIESQGVTYAKVIILCVILLAMLAIRRVHLPTLFRAQQKYGHLSDNFFNHHESLVSTAIVSFVSWIFIIGITAIENNTNMMLNFSTLLLLYIFLSFVLIRIGVSLKKFVGRA